MDKQYGLTAAQVADSRIKFGSNVLSRKKSYGFFKSLLANMKDPIIKVLLFALTINVVFLFGQSNWYESLGIALAVIIAVVVSTLSEYGSENAFKKLAEQSRNQTIRVRREGKTQILAVTELVVGDIIMLSTGDKVPADGVVVEGEADVDQSALNGESKQAHKRVCNTDEGSTDFLSEGALFCGTVVTAGECAMRITKVGDNTVYGRLAQEVLEGTPDSPLKLKLTKLAKKISFYGYIGAGFVAISYLFNTVFLSNGFNMALSLKIITTPSLILKHILTALTLAVTVIVMAVPEGLPMMITVVLSSNMRRMLKDNVLVRKLNGIETAGSMNILFTDKTGTLTYGRPEVLSFVTGQNEVIDAYEFAGGQSELARIMRISISENNGAELVNYKAAAGNATDRALLDYSLKFNAAPEKFVKSNVIQFSSQNKFAAVKIDRGFMPWTKGITLVKGATEKILSHCSAFYDKSGKPQPLSNRHALQKSIEALAARSIRIIAVATSVNDITKDSGFGELTLVGLVGIRDNVRKEAASGVKQLKDAGIQTVMITGDAQPTAVAIAKETGILDKDGLVLTSEQLAGMTDEQLCACLKDLRVVSRALPSDKSRLVRIAQSLNLVAGMTGDGVNDAPALKKADIGFAMGSGTEVAKEAADIVILNDNILSISKAVSYGRTIFKSIRKFIIFQLSINFCAMAVSIIAPLISIETPITVIQMLWINLVIDTLAGLAFGGERPRAKYMLEQPKRRDEPIINGYMWQQILCASVYTAVLSIWFLKSPTIQGLFAGRVKEYSATAFFTLFMFMAFFNSLNARTHEPNLFAFLSLNKQFIWIMSSIAGIQVALIYLGGSVFGTHPLELRHIILVVTLALSVVPMDIIRKLIISRKGRSNGT